MMITLRNRLIAVLAVTLAAAAAAAGAAGPAGDGARPAAGARPMAPAVATGQPTAITVSDQRAAVGYWTQTRMAAAVAATTAASSRRAWLTGNTAGRGLRWVHGGAVTRSVGKVFFTLDRAEYVCSGVALASARADVVLTAAHCVGDGAGRWATNWVFVPGYRDGAEPYGAYAARRFFVSSGWPASEQDDVAFVQVSQSASADGGRPRGSALPGGLPIAFGGRFPRARTYVFGYPTLPPYSGLYANFCAGTAQPAPGGNARQSCTMTAGDSGGPWLTGFRPQRGTGTIVAVSTFKLAGDMRVLYSAVLGSAARRLYYLASVSPAR